MKNKHFFILKNKLVSLLLAFTLLLGIPTGLEYRASATAEALVNAQITLSNIKTGRIARNTTVQITLTDKDTGAAISLADATSVEYNVTPASKASVDSSGLLTANENGAATLNVTVNYSGESPVTLNKNIDVQDSGENLMDAINGSFENVVPDTTPSDWQGVTYAEPATHTKHWYTGVKTATDHNNNANNQVLAFNFDPAIASTGAVGFELMYTPNKYRPCVKSGTIYELSFYIKPDSIVYPAGGTIIVASDIFTYINNSSTSAGSILSPTTDRDYSVTFDASSSTDWQKVTIPVPAPTTYTNSIYISPKFSITATKTKNFSGSILFDDIELREVGYDHVDVDWPTLSETNLPGNLIIQPYATTGNTISIAAAALPAIMTVTSSDTAVVEPAVAVTAESVAKTGNIRGNSIITTKSAGEAEISVSVNVNGVTKTNVKKYTIISNLSELASTTLHLAGSTVSVDGKATAFATSKMSNDRDAIGVSYTYSSDNPDIAKVDAATGAITGIAVGTANITVTASLGGVTKNDTKKMTVGDRLDYPGTKFEVLHYGKAYSDCVTGALIIGNADFLDYGTAGRCWAYLTDTLTDKNNTFLQGGYMRNFPEQGQYLALKINVPTAGIYSTSLGYYACEASGKVGVYIAPLPSDTAVDSSYTDKVIADSANKVSVVDTYCPAEEAGLKTTTMGDVRLEGAGEYILIYRLEGHNAAVTASPKQMLVSGVTFDGMMLSAVSLGFEAETIGVNEKIFASVNGTLDDNSTVDITNAEISYSSANPEIATINSTTGEITGIAAGDANITVTVNYRGVTKSATKKLTVDASGAVSKIEISSNSTIAVGYDLMLTAVAKLANGDKLAIPVKDVTYETVSVNPSGIVTISTDGKVSSTATGIITVRAKATVRGISYTSADFVLTINDVTKAGSTINWTFRLLSNGSGINGRTMTVASRDYNWTYYADNLSLATGALTMLYVCMQISVSKPNEWVAYKVSIPDGGKYFATTEYYAESIAGLAQYYLIPYSGQTTADITAQIAAIAPFGEYNGKGPTPVAVSADVGDVYVPCPGDYLVVVCSKGGQRIYQRALTFTGRNSLNSIDLETTGGDAVNCGNTAQLNVTTKNLDGDTMDLSSIDLAYRSGDPRIASIDKHGLITAKCPGSVEMTVIGSRNGAICHAVKRITVVDTSKILKATQNIPTTFYINQKFNLSVTAEMESGNVFTLPNESVEYTVVSCDPAGALTVSGNELTCNAVGSATIKANVDYYGRVCTTEEITVNIVTSQKTESTIYTTEMRAAMQENAKKYSWAKKEVEAAKNAADKYLNMDETLWNLPVSEGLPRYYWLGEANDPNKWICPYCHANIEAKYAGYAWICDSLNDPWKIQCPECKRRFPSNDFGSYYKLGLDEHGIFNSELAHTRNQELVDSGQPGYLVNILYPEMGEGWMVDDGFGYFTGTVYASGIKQRYNPIAYYIHNALWYCGSPKWGSQDIQNALEYLTTAYVYTGEAKYARSGEILLDRVADLYPGFNWGQWRSFRDDSRLGKILDNGWSCQLVYLFAYAYDAFYPIYDDPYVIKFLSEKAAKYKLDNPKNSKEALVRNIEDNLLREMYKDAVNYTIAGGFGTIQRGIITSAIALDTSPDTEKWLDWVMAAEGTDGVVPRTGGNALQEYINSTDTFDRDGNAYQAAPGYNLHELASTIYMAEPIVNSGKYEKYNLYNNPKIAKLFTAQMEYTLGGYYTPQTGDSGSVAQTGITSVGAMDSIITAFYRLRTPELAQLIYKCNNDSVDGLHYDITVRNPESLASEVQTVINKYGEMNLISKNLTGYGMAILRDGANYKSVNSDTAKNNTTDYSIYYGRNTHHGHDDTLNLFISAFGLNMGPDLGYPEQTGTTPHRIQWVDQTLSHNTVQINGRSSNGEVIHGTPYHFDDSGLVKVLDVDAPKTYAQADIYRRTVVMVRANDDTDYAVDFFRVKGGDSHTYSFHSQSKKIFETKGLDLVKQVDEKGNYVGTLAGPDVPLGNDPNTNLAAGDDGYLKYPTGFTWLYNVRKESSPKTNFEVDFDVTDFRNVLNYKGKDLHLRMTMLSDGYELSELAITSSVPPRVALNVNYGIDNLEYVLAQRKGENLDTLFTTVFEPYQKDRYLDGSESVSIVPISGTPGKDDIARAVKVNFKDGRSDYVVYATNNSVTYRVADLFDFRGFTGVCTVKNKEIVYTYVNDGDTIANKTYTNNAYTGTVDDFTRELSMKNFITVNIDQDVTDADVAALAEHYIYVNNTKESPENGAYRIVSAKKLSAHQIQLNLGDVVLIRGLKDPSDASKGFVNNIEAGQDFSIPLPHEWDQSPVFDELGKLNVDANSQIKIHVNATSPSGQKLTYKANTLPRGASFDPEKQVFTWIPDSKQLGENHVAIEASDGTLSTTAHFMVRVLGNTSGGGGLPPTDKPITQTTKQALSATIPSAVAPITTQPAQSDEPFIDLEGYDWAKDAIIKLANDGVINGMGEKIYAPGENITRADLAVLLVRALTITSDSKDNFADVSSDAYYSEALAIAKANGIVNGLGDNRFNPTARISREDLIVIVSRALEKTGVELEAASNESIAGIKDIDKISGYAKEAVKKLIANGIINGSNGFINPKETATRAEVAVIIMRVLNIISKKS